MFYKYRSNSFIQHEWVRATRSGTIWPQKWVSVTTTWCSGTEVHCDRGRVEIHDYHHPSPGRVDSEVRYLLVVVVYWPHRSKTIQYPYKVIATLVHFTIMYNPPIRAKQVPSTTLGALDYSRSMTVFHRYEYLKGIYPEFQVIRGFSQKIPAGLLSYDQIHS